MTMKTELNETERLSCEGALSRDRDPVVPRGTVVAGEQQGAGAETGKGREGGLLPVTAYQHRASGDVYRADIGDPVFDVNGPGAFAELTPLLPAQERIRALEEAGRELAELHAETRRRWQELEVRLERVRGVVGAAVKMAQETDFAIPGDKEAWKSILDVEKFVDALTPEDREWAEGEEEEG